MKREHNIPADTSRSRQVSYVAVCPPHQLSADIFAITGEQNVEAHRMMIAYHKHLETV